ncbi:alpha/beta fold hydrolase [Dyella sp.]|uniref:alpha/beta fold hydrolase n=1 Tax=Dyella sp. TaxID=1869338 RepID=UPI002ED0D190
MNTKTSPTPSPRPLWQRLLIRRLKFLLIVAVIIGVALGGSYLFAPQWLMRADAARQAMGASLETHSVNVGDSHWVYYEGGQGSITLVLLHGYGADKNVWLKQAKILGQHFHLVIPDLPGWGESSRLDGASYNIDAQAERLAGFVDALRLQHFVLVGHSMGGAIAGVYAADHPEHVAELVLMDSLGLKTHPNDFTRAGLDGKNLFDYDDRAGFERATALTFAKPPQVPGRFIDVLVKRNIANRAFNDKVFKELTDPSQYLSVQNRLDKLTMPVLGIWCQQDKVMDISGLESLRGGLTRSSAISSSILNGCGHMPLLEKPDEVARILTAFALSH